MGKLFYVIGKSATGKDTIFQKLLENESLALKPLVLYTTRPMRAGEEQGVQYHTEATDLKKYNYAGVGVLESYRALRNYYGAERVIPIYIEVEDGERLQRALTRERGQQEPKYAELCRRFLADSEDFAEEKIAEAGIEKRFRNRDLKESIEEISAYIKEHK